VDGCPHSKARTQGNSNFGNKGAGKHKHRQHNCSRECLPETDNADFRKSTTLAARALPAAVYNCTRTLLGTRLKRSRSTGFPVHPYTRIQRQNSAAQMTARKRRHASLPFVHNDCLHTSARYLPTTIERQNYQSMLVKNWRSLSGVLSLADLLPAPASVHHRSGFFTRRSSRQISGENALGVFFIKNRLVMQPEAKTKPCSARPCTDDFPTAYALCTESQRCWPSQLTAP